MAVEVVSDQMNGSGCGVLTGEVNDHLRNPGRRPIRGGVGEMAAGLRFYGAEDLGGAASRVLAVASRVALRAPPSQVMRGEPRRGVGRVSHPGKALVRLDFGAVRKTPASLPSWIHTLH